VSRSHVRIVELNMSAVLKMLTAEPFLAIVSTPSGRVFERRYAARPTEHAVRTDWKNERATFSQVGDARIAWVK
jgi:hypothetical protein